MRILNFCRNQDLWLYDERVILREYEKVCPIEDQGLVVVAYARVKHIFNVLEWTRVRDSGRMNQNLRL